MFELEVSDEYWWPVQVPLVGADGKTKTHTFDARFKRLPQSEIDEIMEKVKDKDILDQEVIDRVLVGWRNIRHQGEEVAFTPENVERLMAVHPTRPNTVQAWFTSLGGKRKN